MEQQMINEINNELNKNNQLSLGILSINQMLSPSSKKLYGLSIY